MIEAAGGFRLLVEALLVLVGVLMLTVLTATGRSSTESSALYTTPIAPRPSSD